MAKPPVSEKTTKMDNHERMRENGYSKTVQEATYISRAHMRKKTLYLP